MNADVHEIHNLDAPNYRKEKIKKNEEKKKTFMIIPAVYSIIHAIF
jgi:hypothetical protein